MREFIHNLLDNQKTHSLLLCGSAFEMPVQYVLANISDMDIMYFPLDICALPIDSTQTPKGFQGKILTIEIDISNSGFARLYDASKSPVKHWKGGPASIAVLAADFTTEHVSKILFQIEGKLSRFKVDRVYGIYCPCWPEDAVEWISRERKYGWPSKDVVERIVKGGCHFIAKSPHSNSSDYTLWRYSFSLAETILVHTWSDVQKYVYHLLKIIKNEVLKDVRVDCKTFLCTYFLKTLIFWACEEKGPEFWKDENVEISVAHLLCLLIECLIEKCCRNYFIPNNNMLFGLIDDPYLNKVIELLSKHCENRNILQMMSTHERAYPKRKFKIAIPNKLLLFFHSYQERECYDNPLEPDMRNYVLDGLTRKGSMFWSHWTSLYEAITIHLRVMSSLKGSDTIADSTSDINLAFAYYVNSFTSVDATRSEKTVCLGETFYEHIAYLCEEMKLDSKFSEEQISDEMTEDKEFGNSVLNFDFSVKRIHRLCCYRRTDRESQKVMETQNSLVSPLLLQTVFQKVAKTMCEPCFLVSAAFLANFCHTTLNVFNRRMATDVFEHTLMRLQDTNANIVASERLYSIAITNKLSSLFDKHFQTVLGFLTLCRSITEYLESSSVLVRICPVQLLKYVGIQFGRYDHFWSDSGLHDFRCDHSFYLSFDLHEPLSEKFMRVVLRLSKFREGTG